MPAVAAILWFDRPVADAPVARGLANGMSEFGPGPLRVVCDGPAALGACESDLEPRRGTPSSNLAGYDAKPRIAWDGYLDNRLELAGLLRCDAVATGSMNDPQLVLAAYQRWGQKCVNYLLGDFAFAIWDPAISSLFCARDPMGARPLYWARTRSCVAFATHDEALFALPGVGRGLRAEALAGWLAPGMVADGHRSDDLSRTWYEDVRFVRSGESIKVSVNGHTDIQRYWEPVLGPPTKLSSDAECREAFLDVFGSAVRTRMPTAGPVAVLMSGGQDSASIVAQLRRSGVSDWHAYSAISDDPRECVETRCILSLAEGLGARFHPLSVPSFQGIAAVQDLTAESWCQSHPEDNDIWLQAVLMRAASRLGHRAILHGTFGDLTNWSPGRYIAYHMRAGRLRDAWAECKAAARNHSMLAGRRPASLALENLGSAFIPSAVKRLAQGLRQARARQPSLALSGDFMRRTGFRVAQPAEAMREPRQWQSVQEWHLRPLQLMTAGRTGLARVAGRHAVNLRDPWDDRRVVQFFLGLSLEHRVRDGWTKYLTRVSFNSELSEEVRWRAGKEHLGWRFKVRAIEQAKALLGSILDDRHAPCWEVLDRRAALGAIRPQGIAPVNMTPEQLACSFTVMTLACWIDRIRSFKP